MGFNVEILGIDGTDKRELLAMVADQCAEAGLSVRRVSWQRELAAAEQDGRLAAYPYDDLHRLWLGLFPVFFGDAVIDGERLAPPTSLTEIATSGLFERLHRATITGMLPASPLATGWLEMAGHTLLHYAVVQPMIAQGHLVIQDSLGVKNVTKSLFMAGFMQPDRAAELASARHHMQQYFGQALAPGLGIYLREDPAAMLATVDSKGIGVFDCYRAFGGDSAQTYVELQTGCAADFETFAAAYGWSIVDLSGPSRAGAKDAADHITQVIMRHAAEAMQRRSGADRDTTLTAATDVAGHGQPDHDGS